VFIIFKTINYFCYILFSIELVKIKIYIRFSVFIIFKIIHYFCYILSRIELVKIKIYQIFSVYYISLRYSLIFATLFCSVLNLETEESRDLQSLFRAPDSAS
jgi:hypothetical protein